MYIRSNFHLSFNKLLCFPWLRLISFIFDCGLHRVKIMMRLIHYCSLSLTNLFMLFINLKLFYLQFFLKWILLNLSTSISIIIYHLQITYSFWSSDRFYLISFLTSTTICSTISIPYILLIIHLCFIVLLIASFKEYCR